MSKANERIRLNNIRVSYLHVFKPKPSDDGSEPKYGVQVIIPKDHKQIGDLKKAILKVAKEAYPKMVTGNKISARLKTPLRDGDEEREYDLGVYGGMYFFNANSKKRPGAYDRDRTPLAEEDNVLYSGCYCNVIIDIYDYDTKGNRGIAAGFGGIQFVRDGEALGGKGVTAEDFDELEEPEDDDYGI